MFDFRFALLASIVSVLALIAVLRPAVKGDVAPSPRPHTAKPSLSGATATIWAPYWKLGGGFEATLLINNTKPHPILVQPLVYTTSGRLLPATTVSLEKL